MLLIKIDTFYHYRRWVVKTLVLTKDKEQALSLVKVLMWSVKLKVLNLSVMERES